MTERLSVILQKGNGQLLSRRMPSTKAHIDGCFFFGKGPNGPMLPREQETEKTKPCFIAMYFAAYPGGIVRQSEMGLVEGLHQDII